MARRDIIVIGASAGGVEALRDVVACLPADLPAAVVVVVHVPPTAKSALPAILCRVGKLPAEHARHGERLVTGRIYVAPPDSHVLVHGSVLHLSRGPRVNNHRPAIDPLFFSAAKWGGPRTISVVLSGLLDDGTHGTAAVRLGGGVTVAQSLDEALFPMMPQNAIDHGGVDHVLPATEIAALLVELAGAEVPERRAFEIGVPEIEDELDPAPIHAETASPASGFTCPDCQGALWETESGSLLRFRCRIGHSYATESLLAAQAEKLEEALRTAHRALVERAALAKLLAANARSGRLTELAACHESRYEDAQGGAKMVRIVLGLADKRPIDE